MGSTTAIEWTDKTWNPSVGCDKVSAGCKNCYAETLVNRFGGKSPAYPNGPTSGLSICRCGSFRG